MTEKNMAKADFYTAIVLMVCGITATVMALQMPGPPGEQSPYSAPGLLPTVLGIVIAGLGLIMFIRALARAKGDVGISLASFKAFLSATSTRRIIATIVICLVYVFLLGKVWYPLLTFLFVFGFAALFEYDRGQTFRAQIKKILLAALLALCTTAVVTVLFQYLFLVRLP